MFVAVVVGVLNVDGVGIIGVVVIVVNVVAVVVDVNPQQIFIQFRELLRVLLVVVELLNGPFQLTKLFFQLPILNKQVVLTTQQC